MAEALHEKWLTATDKKEALRERVGEWKRGRWTPLEQKRLKKNVRRYLKTSAFESVQEVVFMSECGQREDFFRCAAEGIRRPLFSVYRKVQRVYDLKNKIKWSPSLVARLVRNHKRYGNNWAAIGRKIGVAPQLARDKYRNMTDRQRTGKWLPDEVERLVYAVKKVGKLCSTPALEANSTNHGSHSTECELHSTESTYTSSALELNCDEVGRVSERAASSGEVGEGMWKRVASLVATRNCLQCRQKWLFHQEWKDKGGSDMWTTRDDVLLLETLLMKVESEGVEDEDGVDWAELAQGWESARWSPYYLRTKWTSLRRQVPRASLLGFQDNLSYLEEHLLPTLRSTGDTRE